MKKFIINLLKKLLKKFGDEEIKTLNSEENKRLINENPIPQPKKIPSKKSQKKGIAIISESERAIRDFTEMMENPFLALSKKRKEPIIYESPDGTRKIKVTRHTGHFLASIYDWDIV